MTTLPESPAPAGHANAAYWQISKKKTRRGLKVLALVAVLCFLALIFLPTDYHDTPANAWVSTMILLLGPTRAAIAEQLKASPQLPIHADIARLIPDELAGTFKGNAIRIDYKAVSPDGVIIVFSPQLGVLIVLSPRMEAGEVRWSCRGSAVHKWDLPKLCRE
jgi:hypothetical protein